MAERELAPDDPCLAWDGLVALEVEDGWWQPWRLPPGRIGTAMSAELVRQARTPTGVRFGLRTDARSLQVRLRSEVWRAVPLDVLVDGRLAHRLPVGDGDQVLEVELPGRPADVEVWLPHWGLTTRVGGIRLTGGGTPEPLR